MFSSSFNQSKLKLDLIFHSPHSNVHMINFAKVYKAEIQIISLTRTLKKTRQSDRNVLVPVQIKKIHH